jgi:hypothetical protein
VSSLIIREPTDGVSLNSGCTLRHWILFCLNSLLPTVVMVVRNDVVGAILSPFNVGS